MTRAVRVGPWRIDITIRDGVAAPTSGASLARAAARAAEAAGAPSPASIGLILSGDDELAMLNRDHLGKAGPTDVLSFPLLPPGAYPGHLSSSGGAVRLPAFVLPPGRRPHLGDIVVSVQRAAAQAGAGRGGQTGDVRWSTAEELHLLVTHGTLHLCGWDHADPAEEAAMRSLERLLLSA